MTTIQKWGNSLAVRIPANLASQIELGEGVAVDIFAEHGSIVVRPHRPAKYELSELLKNCQPGQLHGETDFGQDVGCEVVQ